MNLVWSGKESACSSHRNRPSNLAVRKYSLEPELSLSQPIILLTFELDFFTLQFLFYPLILNARKKNPVQKVP